MESRGNEDHVSQWLLSLTFDLLKKSGKAKNTVLWGIGDKTKIYDNNTNDKGMNILYNS